MSASQPEMNDTTSGWFTFRWAYVIILAAVLIYSVKFVTKYSQAHQLAVQVAAAHYHLYQQSQHNKQLARDIRYYKTLPFVYQEARSWGYVRVGDRPVIVAYHYLPPARHGLTGRSLRKPAPTWQQWWEAFFGGSSR